MKKSKKKQLKAARAAAIAEADGAPLAVAPLAVEIDWRELLLVCTRCAGKLPDRLDAKGRTLLRGEIRDALKARGGKREARVMETGCFGLCPRHGQVVATASGLRQGKLYVFEGGDSGEAIVRSLLPAAEAPPGP